MQDPFAAPTVNKTDGRVVVDVSRFPAKFFVNDQMQLGLGLATTDANCFTTILRIAKVTLLSLMRGHGSLRGHNTN